jgi:PPK2 family polyphosphate:nucleotide phosphotransferase
MAKPSNLVKRFRIDKPATFRLADYDCADTGGIDIDKRDAKDKIADDVARLAELQERLYAGGRWALLIVLQGMDASGKDSAIEHVMSGINPQGCEVTSFKQPTPHELAHDFLWRHAARLPERGRIGTFNRSHYEEVLTVRVHPELLAKQRLPEVDTRRIWSQRFEDIRAFEQRLARNGTKVLKFFLHISKKEQRQRFLDRLDDPAKRWKFSFGDVAERKLWPRYMAAYEDMIRHTSTAHAPWYVVPSDHKWFSRLVIARALTETLTRLHPHPPAIDKATLRKLMAERKALAAE